MGHERTWTVALPASVVVALTVAASACSSSPGSTSSTTAASVAGKKSETPSTVKVVGNSTYGKILVDSAGKALYTYGPDKGHGGQSTCTGACLALWPALTVAAGSTPSAATGVTGTVRAVKQADGSYQVTYDGMPLYTFVQDSSAGQVTGNNLEGFAVVTVAAQPAGTSGAPGGSSATTGTTPSSGYGY